MRALGIGLLVAVATAACGPIVYVNEVTRHASTRVDEARAVQADKYAPYWWTRATQYLHQSRVKASRSDFQGANRFGRLAGEAADKAIEEAQVAAKDPAKRPLELAPAKPSVAPAKDTP